jgi:tetratricopeptide (TPR) repeat protein
MIMQRADEVNAIQRMLSDAQTTAVMIVGTPGGGKSTLMALVFRTLLQAQQAGLATPQQLLWLSVGAYTTLTDVVAAILAQLGSSEPNLSQLSMEEQFASLLQRLRQPQVSVLVALDQFEALHHPSTPNANPDAVLQFFEMLQSNLGNSRFLLTSYDSPFEEQNMAGIETSVRSYLVSRISLPEGVTLLQQRGMNGSPEDLTLVWRRCSGHVFSLVLFCSLAHLSGISLNYFLTSPDYQPMWAGEIAIQLITAIYHFMKPVQYLLLRSLGLFFEPVPLEGVVTTMAGGRMSNNIDFASFERELAQLTGLALVQQVPGRDNRPCYLLHPLLRSYVLEYYVEQPGPRTGDTQSSGSSTLVPRSAEELRQALANGHAQAASYYQQCFLNPYPSHAQRTGVQDVAPLVSAIRHLCHAGQWQNACDLLFQEELHESLMRWQAWDTLIELYTALLSPSSLLLRRDEGLIASQLGLLYGRQGNYLPSQHYFEQALETLHQLGDMQGQGSILLNQGELLRSWGERDLARQSFERALQLNGQTQGTALQCAALHNLGLLYHEEQAYKKAFKCYSEALKLAQDGPSARYRGMILLNLGMLFYEQQVYKEALALLLAALQTLQSQHDPSALALERFLQALTQKMGPPLYEQTRQEALQVQSHVLSRILASDMRQS